MQGDEATDATPHAAESQSDVDVSNAVAWATECTVNGVMRSWIDLDGELSGCDGMLWTASLVLLRHLEVTHPPGWWRGKRVLECGSGTGHLAVGLARLGATVVATESAESHNGALSSGFVTMTSWIQLLLRDRPGGGIPIGDHQGEQDPAQPGGPALSAGDDAHGGSVQFRKLHWGLDDVPPNSWEGFDVLILAELYFDPDLHEPLLETLTRILHPGMTCYSCFVDRPFSLGFLIMLDDEGSFDVEQIEPKETFAMIEDDIIHTHIIRRLPAATT